MNHSLLPACDQLPTQPTTLKPRFALEVAVVGNRDYAKPSPEEKAADVRVAARMRARAREGFAAVWSVVLDAMRQTLGQTFEVSTDVGHGDHAPTMRREVRQFFSEERPRLGVLSSLAAGADQIGVRAAVVAGDAQVEKKVGDWPAPKAEVDLEAILPFPAADYPGLPGARRKEFREVEARILEKLTASAGQVLRLDGCYAPPGVSHEKASASRRRAYQQARDILLQNADLLVASYNPEREGNVAGTLETVNLALKAGMPVVVVLVAENEVRLAIYTTLADRPPADEWQAAGRLDDTKWREQLTQRVRYLLSLPHMLVPPEPEREDEVKKRRKNLAQTVARLDAFYREKATPFSCRCPIRGPIFDFAWEAMLDLGLSAARPHGFHHIPAPPRADDSLSVQPYAKYYQRASELSAAFMRVYRGAFVLAFALAGFAVAAAVAVMAISLSLDHRPPVWILLLLGGVKIVILLSLLLLEHGSHRHHYQEQATDYRFLAELLRPMQWLAPVAMFTPSAELPAHYAPLDPRQSWTTWLFRAIARATPCVGGCERIVNFSKDTAKHALRTAREQWVKGQINYHWGLAQRMHGIENGLEAVSKRLLWVVLSCAIVALWMECFYKECHAAIAILSACAAAFPAFIAALAGIMFQSEAKRLELRSEAMYHGLRRQSDALDKAIKSLDEPGNLPGGETWAAALYLRELAKGMILETSEWKALYQMHEIKAG